MSEIIFEQIKQFINEKWDLEGKELLRETSLERDLGITGDDADEIIFAFVNKFKVDYSEFDSSKYFGSEPPDFISPILNLFNGKKSKERLPLTVGDLEKAVIMGKLV